MRIFWIFLVCFLYQKGVKCLRKTLKLQSSVLSSLVVYTWTIQWKVTKSWKVWNKRSFLNYLDKILPILFHFSTKFFEQLYAKLTCKSVKWELLKTHIIFRVNTKFKQVFLIYSQELLLWAIAYQINLKIVCQNWTVLIYKSRAKFFGFMGYSDSQKPSDVIKPQNLGS